MGWWALGGWMRCFFVARCQLHRQGNSKITGWSDRLPAARYLAVNQRSRNRSLTGRGTLASWSQFCFLVRTEGKVKFNTLMFRQTSSTPPRVFRDPSARPPPASLSRQVLPPSFLTSARVISVWDLRFQQRSPGLDTPEQIASPVAPRQPLTDGKIGSRAQITCEAWAVCRNTLLHMLMQITSPRFPS